MQSLVEWMAAAEVDMTLFFRALSDLGESRPTPDHFSAAFYDDAKREASAADLEAWLDRYASRLASDAQAAEQRRQRMRAANPRYVLRNWLAQQAIDKANAGRRVGNPRTARCHAQAVRRPARPRTLCPAPTGLGEESCRLLDAVLQFLSLLPQDPGASRKSVVSFRVGASP